MRNIVRDMKEELFDQIEELHGIGRANILTVSQVNEHIHDALSNNPKLNRMYVLGEITNSAKKNGHVYFGIKDEESLIQCILFAGNNKLSFKIENGLNVLVFGSINLYKKRGVYQLNVFAVFPVGEGAFHLQFKQLKEKLSKEGLFDEKHKKEIPAIPKTIGVITSKTSAACRDVLEIIRGRFPNMTIKLADTLTQGPKAPQQIINAIKTMNHIKSVDVVILTRGGGSIEDLMCFNDEQLARAIFASNIPIVTGIGHETDYTIADFVADKRASTPSVAAKLAVIDKSDLIDEVSSVRDELKKSYNNYLASELKDKKLKRYKIAVIGLIILILIFTAMKLLNWF